jgi:hypothetical protein
LVIFPKNPKIPLIFPKIFIIPENPKKSSKFPQKSSKLSIILKNPQNLTIRKFH